MDNYTFIQDSYPIEPMSQFTIINQLSSYLGINSMIIMFIIISSLAIILYILTYLYFGSPFFASLTSLMPIVLATILGFVPIWILLLYGILGLTQLFFKYGSTSQVEQIATEDMDKWDIYANRLKDAYSAKFGGENSGFNQEVDLRIKVMQHNRNGFTHTIARDWLKRMERFTEAK